MLTPDVGFVPLMYRSCSGLYSAPTTNGAALVVPGGAGN